MKLMPELLLHPQIVTPLHGLNPRTLKGKAWWDARRLEAYAKHDYHCYACGVHKSQAKYHRWLEAHEQYDIDYEKGRMEITGIVALCHICHNHIHSGRLEALLQQGKIQRPYFEDVLWHGFEVLANAPDKRLNPFAVGVAERNGITQHEMILRLPYYEVALMPETSVPWSDWRMVLEGVEYAPLWKNEQEHAKHYGGLS